MTEPTLKSRLSQLFFYDHRNGLTRIQQNAKFNRMLNQIILVKLIIFYHLCSYLCIQIYNQKGIFYVQIRITPSFKKDNSFI